MKIFICENDPYRAKLMQDILSVYNYKIVTVGTKGDFYKKAQNQKPAIIVISEMFSQNSGQEMLNQVRNNPETANIPVIYISNDMPIEQQIQAHQNDGLTEFVHEPIKIKNLRHYVDRWTTFRSLYVRH